MSDVDDSGDEEQEEEEDLGDDASFASLDQFEGPFRLSALHILLRLFLR